MEAGKPNVDVLILTCGDYSGLGRTIESVLAQQFPIHSVILSDDGSKKPFPGQIVRRLQEIPAQVTIRNGEKNLGTVAHMNAVARLTDGNYLKFLASGDAFSDGGALDSLVTFAGQTDMPVVTSNCVVCSPDLKRRYYRFPGTHRGKRLSASGQELFSALVQGNVISAVGTLLRRDFFQGLGGFDESYHLLEDWPAWLRLARTGYSIPCLPRVTGLYAVGGISSVNGNAFCAPLLRDDMLHCYEKEILPYLKTLDPDVKHAIFYSYERLKGTPARELSKKYFSLMVKNTLKRGVKTCMMKVLG